MKRISTAIAILAVFAIVTTLYAIFWKEVLIIALSAASNILVIVLGDLKGDSSCQTCKDLSEFDTDSYPKVLVIALIPAWLLVCWIAVTIDLVGVVYRWIVQSPPRRWIILPI